jgi:mono/diheme cytochrome c family protein
MTTPAPPRGPGQPLTRLRSFAIPIAALLLAIGGGISLGFRSAGNAADEIDSAVTSTPVETTDTGAKTTPAAQVRESARNVFLHSCGSCQTLAAAGANGGIGPNLDEARPTRERVRAMIRNGALSGAMPAGLLTGDDADRVAAYVSRVAGRP